MDRRIFWIDIAIINAKIEFITKQIEEQLKTESSAQINYNIKDDNLWVCLVDLKSFESIHGVSRIVKLIPDKLATAIAINKENLSDPKDDGSFLVDLVIKLLKFYQEQVQKNCEVKKDEELSEIKAKLQLEMKRYNFLDILNKLSDELKTFNDQLKTRNNDVIKSQAEVVLKLADNLQIFCNVYLNFVHPSLIQVTKIYLYFDLLHVPKSVTVPVFFLTMRSVGETVTPNVTFD